MAKSRILFGRVSGILAFVAALLLSLVCCLVPSSLAHAVARQSTLSLQVSEHSLAITFEPVAGGSFDHSAISTITVSTDNYTGYSLSIVSDSSTDMVSGDNNTLPTLDSAVSESDFSTNVTYNNKWGYKPSQYINSGSVVSNTNYLPAPNTTTGDLIAVTSAANSANNSDNYSLSFGARIDTTQPAGAYTYTYVITAVANSLVYNITYDDDTSETVTNMPSPNPQTASIDGGTPAVDSYITLSNAVPTMTSDDMSFAGWCTVHTTLNSVTNNYECIGGTTYQPGDDYPIDQTAGPNITLYAIWIDDPFPMVWSQMGKCVFTATQIDSNTYDGDVSGSECSEYAGDDYIDTGIALYSNDNYQKDYEVHFTLDSFNPGGQRESQATIFNDKLSSSVTTSPYGGKSPGVVVRITSSKTFEIKSTYGAPTDHVGDKIVTKTPYATAYNGTDVRIFRINGIIYTSIDNGPLVELQDYTPFNQQFGLTAWFGAYPDNVNCTENCTAAKRFLTGELSNMYIKLGDMPADRLHNITFNSNYGNPADTTTHLILDGDALMELPEVTRDGWLFDGWWTASSGGQQISAATVPTADTTYWAHWYKSVADANITNTSVALSVLGTETISITNAADIEPYTLVSSDPTVATVSSAGVITGVANGTATITMTGTKTGDTRTISVEVGSVIYVDFDSDGGTPATYQESVPDGGSFSSLPEPTRAGYDFEGWYTGRDGGGTQLTTSTVFDSNTPTQYYAKWAQATYVCKAATTLHTEMCSRTSGGCYAVGYRNNGDPITYGSLIQHGATSLTAGNALDCDINDDGTFDAATERFYYFTTVDNNAALIYYKNTSNAENLYDDALALLPDSNTAGWTNPNLVVYDSQLMSGDYNGKNTRFISYDEMVAACNNSTTEFGANGKCLYVLEQSNFAYTNIRDGYWIGRANHSTRVHTQTRKITDGSQRNGVRPVIEVPLSMIDLTVISATYDITFDPHNETNTWTETIDAGDDLTDVYPANNPTYTNHLFQGWFTAASGGTQISSSTVPSGDTEYHAQWKKTVTLATLASDSFSIEEGNTEAIVVTNSAELEGYSFSSLDTSIATVDSTTGMVTGVAEGTTTVRMTGATSGAYKDIAITVTEAQTIATVCRLAVAGSLHTSPSGYYGQIASSTTPQPGDAYDCDVNNDDNYNATNERFYYLGQDGSNNAVLVAWNSYYGGSWAPGTSNDNNYNYANALAQLPSNAAGAWDHPGLIEQDTGKAARFTNYTEVVSACGNIDVTASGALDACDFLMEHSAYDSGGRSALWLNYDGSTYRRIHAGSGNHLVGTANPTTSNNMVRPAIVVPYNLIEKYVAPQYTVTFNSMGGSSVSDAHVDQNMALGSNYPSTNPTKADNKFFGWYTDTTYDTEVTPETVVNGNVTYYARWIEDTSNFPIVWSEINECTFNNTSNISGTYCAQPKNISYVDTNVQLFTSTDNNYAKDFEIGFTITEYNVADQAQSQATLVNSKLEATGYPGFVVRRESGKNNFELTAKFAGTTNSPIGGDSIAIAPESLHHVRIVRQNNKLYYALNGGALTEWWDLTGFTARFDTEVWFGASANSSNAPWRGLVGKLTDMYVRLGTYQAPSTYTIQFNPNGGEITSGSASVDITPGDTIGSFPTVTRAGNYTFTGWYDSNDNPVTTSTRPDRSQTYHAGWSYNSSKTPVTFDVANAAVTGYDTIVKSYAPSITTFNEADPINNSTWGVAKSTYLGALQTNFETNNCMAVPQEDSQIDWGGSHTVNCSKPSVFDTGRTGGVNVYEYDVANDTLIGTALTYTKSSGGLISNLIPGHDYYWEDVSDSSIYGVISAVSSASDRRLLDVGNVWNVRDLGGLPVDTNNDGTIDGTIEYGMLVRGGRLNTTSSNITELQNLGIDKEYDLAGSGELSPDVQFSGSNYVNDEVIHYQFDYGTIVDNEDTYAMARQAVTDIMNDVIGGNNVYFHCRVGADRTGTVAYILEGLLGVPDEQRYRDYELTSVSGLNDRTRYYAQKSSTNNKKFIFMMGYLQTTADIMTWYLKDTSDTGAAARVAAFRSAMIVPSNQQQQSPQNSPQQSPQQLNLQSSQQNSPQLSLQNSGESEDESEGVSQEKGETTDVIEGAENGYSNPLGETKTTGGTTVGSEPSSLGGVAAIGLAVAGIATAVAAATGKEQG